MRFRSSALGRVMNCTGSWLKEDGKPRILPAFDASEHTIVHDISAQCIQHSQSPSVALGKEWNNAKDGNGEVIPPMMVTHEMVDAATAYVDHCNTVGGPEAMGGVETSGVINLAGVGVVVPGTRDHWAVNATELHISDLKYGYGWVYPEMNWQLISYAIMTWEEMQQQYPGWAPATVFLHVIQPRAFGRRGGPVYTWSFPGELLRNYRNQMQNTLGRASLPDAPLTSGSWCRYCRYILECEVNRAAAGECLEVSGHSTDGPMEPIETAVQLSEIDSAMERLKHRRTALEAHGITAVKGGQILPGYEMRQTWGRESWSVADPIAAGDEMGVDLRAEQKPITPAQAVSRKLITKEMITYMAARKPTGHTLKRVDMDAVRRIVNS